MAELNDILAKLSIKEIGRHLSNYAYLYIQPVKSWKKAFTYRRDGYDFIVYNIIYYFLLVLVIVKDYYLAIPITLLEVVVTIIPHLVFYPSLRFFTNKFNKRVSWKQQFRLFLIIKFQCVPIVIGIVAFAKWTDLESYYLLLDNFLFILWSLLIVATPLLIKLEIWKKTLWLAANYISFLLYVLLFGLLVETFDIKGKVSDKLSHISPSMEYGNIKSKSTNANLWISDDNFMLIGEVNDSGIVRYNKTQFVSSHLALRYYETLLNDNQRQQFLLDSVLCSMDSSRTSKKDSIKWDPYFNRLTKAQLDSFRVTLDSIVSNDISLCKAELKNVEFTSNKTYLRSYLSYLNLYYQSYVENDLINKLLENSKKGELLMIEPNFVCVIFKVDTNFYNPTRQEYFEKHKSKENEFEKSMIVANLLLFPIFKGMDVYYD
jgi:hypothetical protein